MNEREREYSETATPIVFDDWFPLLSCFHPFFHLPRFPLLFLTPAAAPIPLPTCVIVVFLSPRVSLHFLTLLRCLPSPLLFALLLAPCAAPSRALSRPFVA
jgi:hypothetical protein